MGSVPDLKVLLENLTPVVLSAGNAIMDVYDGENGTEWKDDGSPVTLADKRAELILLEGLNKFAPNITIVSEENPDSHSLDAGELFFLVDPLDGTKEFLKRDGKGSFTVNIGLIEKGVPIFGIVFAPALNRTFSGISGVGAWENDTQISIREIPASGSVAVASASHRDAATDLWLKDNHVEETVSIGSSLKFCLLACGEADVYPRFGPTMEWDTCAGHAVLNAAGGCVETPDGRVFEYSKPEFKNGNFVAYGQKVSR